MLSRCYQFFIGCTNPVVCQLIVVVSGWRPLRWRCPLRIVIEWSYYGVLMVSALLLVVLLLLWFCNRKSPIATMIFRSVSVDLFLDEAFGQDVRGRMPNLSCFSRVIVGWCVLQTCGMAGSRLICWYFCKNTLLLFVFVSIMTCTYWALLKFYLFDWPTQIDT